MQIQKSLTTSRRVASRMNQQSTRNFSDHHGPVDIHHYLTLSNSLYARVPAG
jgi:hypothetical protein